MRRNLIAAASIAAALTWGSGIAFAHHSATATYLVNKTIKIEGTLKEFVWRNPHSFMKVEAPDEKGEKQSWTIEGAAPQQLTEAGLTTTTLRAGDHVIVSGSPGRIEDDHRMLLDTIERPSDGFKWQGPAAGR
jgi:hypothetical protein